MLYRCKDSMDPPLKRLAEMDRKFRMASGGANSFWYMSARRGDLHQCTAPIFMIPFRWFRTERGAGAFFVNRCSCFRRFSFHAGGHRSGSTALQPYRFCRRISGFSSTRRIFRPRTAISNRISAFCWIYGRRPCKIIARIPLLRLG